MVGQAQLLDGCWRIILIEAVLLGVNNNRVVAISVDDDGGPLIAGNGETVSPTLDKSDLEALIMGINGNEFIPLLVNDLGQILL